MDLLTNPDETHYIGHNSPAKVSYFSQLALGSKKGQGKELQGVKALCCILWHQIKTLTNPLETHIAKLTHLKKLLPANSKQFMRKQARHGILQQVIINSY